MCHSTAGLESLSNTPTSGRASQPTVHTYSHSSLLQNNSFFKGFFVLFCFRFNFIYFWLRWVFVAVHGLFLVVASGDYSSLLCAGLSLRWLPLLWSMGSRHVGVSSCGMWAQQLWHTGSRLQAQ